MRSTFSLLPYINRSKVRADGTTAVLCRITIDGKQTAISTGIYCRPEDWNGRKNEIKTVRENNRLREYLRLTEEAYTEILKSQGVVSAEMLKNHISLNNIHPTTLLQMGEWERERLKKHSEEIDSTSSYRHSMYYQKYLTDFIASIGKKEIPLEEVTEDFGKSYKAFLKKCKNFSSSQTNKCMCWLNRLLYLAVDKEIIRVNPCEDLEYEPKPEARHRYISRDEFKKILSTPMYDKRMELARRAFIFSTLTGLAYVDIKLLHPHHIGTNAEGRRYIRINRKKTKVEAFIPLHPIAEQILSLYNTTDDEKPVFPLPSRDSLWFDIHEMGVAIGKEENLSYHQSRHSFGTFLISADIPIESIAKMMGHSNIRTTQGYARITDDKISKDMDKRAGKPFVAVDCGSLSRELAPSAFFGHVKGAFTGADSTKKGYFHEAEGGTLFLDEVGNLALETQQMLLRAIQERRYRPVGDKSDKSFNVRIIAATNEDLEAAVSEKRFRQDLLYRLQDFVITVPPLRDCQEDIMPLAEFFREIANKELECNVSGFSSEARKALLTHAWPGNVRELRQKIMGAVLQAQEGVVTKEHLELAVTKPTSPVSFALRNDAEDKERIMRALKQTNGNRSAAAELLGISRATLYSKLEEYGLKYKFKQS